MPIVLREREACERGYMLRRIPDQDTAGKASTGNATQYCKDAQRRDTSTITRRDIRPLGSVIYSSRKYRIASIFGSPCTLRLEHNRKVKDWRIGRKTDGLCRNGLDPRLRLTTPLMHEYLIINSTHRDMRLNHMYLPVRTSNGLDGHQ
jgi:hypothetical protein